MTVRKRPSGRGECRNFPATSGVGLEAGSGGRRAGRRASSRGAVGERRREKLAGVAAAAHRGPFREKKARQARPPGRRRHEEAVQPHEAAGQSDSGQVSQGRAGAGEGGDRVAMERVPSVASSDRAWGGGPRPMGESRRRDAHAGERLSAFLRGGVQELGLSMRSIPSTSDRKVLKWQVMGRRKKT